MRYPLFLAVRPLLGTFALMALGGCTLRCECCGAPHAPATRVGSTEESAFLFPPEFVDRVFVSYIADRPARLRLAYVDSRHNVYRWRGAVIPASYVIGGSGSGPGWLEEEDVREAIWVDPPIDYVLVGPDLAAPGYYDNSSKIFYEWPDVFFRPSQVNSPRIGVERHPDGDEKLAILTMLVPSHLKAFAEEIGAKDPAATDKSEDVKRGRT